MTKSYIYSDAGQILCQRAGGQNANEFFYVTDRLGSVRQVVDKAKAVVLDYTYSPFGQLLDTSGTFANNFMYTGQWFDSEFSQYYLRARMYDPVLGRLTSYDPVKGKLENPLSLHQFLYCQNDPVNRLDPSGEAFWNTFGAVTAGMAVHSAAIYTLATGIQYDNDMLMDLGLQMEYLVAPAMAFGALTGPLLPSVPGAATKGLLNVWGGLAGGVGGGVKALSYWAMANPYEFISIVDVLGQIGGTPDTIPVTPAGWVTWYYMWSKDNE